MKYKLPQKDDRLIVIFLWQLTYQIAVIYRFCDKIPIVDRPGNTK